LIFKSAKVKKEKINYFFNGTFFVTPIIQVEIFLFWRKKLSISGL